VRIVDEGLDVSDDRLVVENMDFADDGEEEGEDEHGGRPQVVPQKVEEASEC